MEKVRRDDREGRERTLKHHGADVIKRAGQLAPVTYIIRLQGTLALALEQLAIQEGVNAETIIAELIRQYMGDDR